MDPPTHGGVWRFLVGVSFRPPRSRYKVEGIPTDRMALGRALKDTPTYPNQIYANIEEAEESGIVALFS